MSLYMTQVSYTSEASAALTHNPEDRGEAFGRVAESMGGRMLSFYYSLGEYDVLASTRPPAKAPPRQWSWPPPPGHLSKVKTTVLLSAEEGMEAMRKAGGATYRALGQ